MSMTLLGAGGTFNPNTIAGLQGWYEARLLTGLADTNAISSFTDMSSNARHLTQATGSLQPLYRTNIVNGQPVARFDGTDDFVTLAYTLAQPSTRFLVCAYRSAWTVNEVAIDGNGGLNAAILRTSSTNMAVYAGLGPVGTTATTPQSFHVYTAEFNGASSGLRADGGTNTTGNAGANTSGGLTFGADGTAGQDADVDIAAVLVYNSILAAADRQRVERWLGGIYGITVA